MIAFLLVVLGEQLGKHPAGDGGPSDVIEEYFDSTLGEARSQPATGS